MRKTREILRLIWEKGRSQRDVHASLQVGLGTVCETLKRAKEADLDWETVQLLDDAALDLRLHGPRAVPECTRPMPDPVQIALELKRPGVTLELLHQEYLEAHPDGYRYSQFCEIYRSWKKNQGIAMRQEHRAGEKAFVDYSGKRPCLVDPLTGECTEVELFVGVLGASNFTYAEVTATQQVHDWIGSHVRMFEHFEGATETVVPDQLRSGVTRPCWYEPGVQRTYEDLARHYRTVVVPARPRKPKDKAKVEVGVQIAQRWILARMRNERHATLGSMNARIRELLDILNHRKMRGYGMSRRELFERLDRPALKPLPSERFVMREWSTARVNIDYHIEHDHHYYSVPFTYRQEQVEVCATGSTVEIFLHGNRIALHARSFVAHQHTTIPEHMPRAHREHAEWSPERLCRWAERIGESTGMLVKAILEERPHPEQGYRSCLGILRLRKLYGDERLEAACARAVLVRARSYRHIESILKNGLDRLPVRSDGERDEDRPRPAHGNIRGPGYYH